MNRQDAKASRQFGVKKLLLVTAAVAVLFAVMMYVRTPIRNARKIQPGDPAQRVHALLGSPELVFETHAELRQSYLVPNSFVFTDTGNTMFDVPVSGLPFVKNRAEWFPMGPTAGHLVYYSDEGVEIVFWGGT